MHKVLLFLANPQNDLKLPAEYSAINSVPKIHVYAQLVPVYDVAYDDFNQQLRGHHDTAIFHFGGHGEGDRILLQDDSFYRHGLIDQIAGLKNLQLVVLNCCKSKEIGEELVNQGIPYVVCTDSNVKDDVAIHFATHFYSALAQDKTIKAAYEDAKAAVTGKHPNPEEEAERALPPSKRNATPPKTKFEWQLIANANPEAWRLSSPEKAIWSYHKTIAAYYSEQHPLNEAVATLADLYIEPNFSLHKVSFGDKSEVDNEGFREFEQNNIHAFVLNSFLQNKPPPHTSLKENSRLLLLLGQPGQGKSSFCLRVIHDCLKEPHLKRHYYLIRLRNIDHKAFLNNPFDAVAQHIEKIERIPFHEENTLLLLDGLDELSMRAGLNNEEVNDLLHRLIKELNNYPTLHCILTSRYHYFKVATLVRQPVWVAKLAALTAEQQQQWLEKYRPFKKDLRLTAQQLQNISKQENYKYLAELLTQPILLHIVAQINFDVQQVGNRSKIYEQLFTVLCEHSWNKQAIVRYKEGFTPIRLREYISEVAFQIYISEFDYIRRNELENLNATKEFRDDCLQTNQTSSEALKEVLVSFYFKDKEKPGEDQEETDKESYAIEFLHKSLQEYLTAEHIWRSISNEFLATQKKGGKQDYAIHNGLEALRAIWEIGSPKRLSQEVFDYLMEVIENDQTTDKKTLAERLSLFLGELLQKQFIYEHKAGTTTSNPIDKGLDCFYLYWQVLMQSSKTHFGTENCPNYLTYNNKQAFWKLLHFAGREKTNFILCKQDLQRADLFGASLIEADLSRALLNMAFLNGAFLLGADLNGAYLNGAYLSGTELSEADLSGAYLSGAYLSGAELSGAHLNGAHLNGAVLNGAHLNGAVLNGADLIGVYLNGAYVDNANWIDQLKKLKVPPKGIEDIEKIYEVVEISKDRYQLIKRK